MFLIKEETRFSDDKENDDTNVIDFHWSIATDHSWQHDERERQAKQICSVPGCMSHWQWTVETRCQCSRLWWSAALNSFSHKTLSLLPNSSLNRSCKSSSSDRWACNIMMWCCRHYQQLLMLQPSLSARTCILQRIRNSTCIAITHILEVKNS